MVIVHDLFYDVYCNKAVGSGKAGKALALPLFVSSNNLFKRMRVCTHANIQLIVYAFIMASFKEGDGPHQPKNYPFPKRAFGKKSIIHRSFQPGWFKR